MRTIGTKSQRLWCGGNLPAAGAKKWRAMMAQAERIESNEQRASGGLKSQEMEHREAHHLEGMDVSAVQNIQVEGRHSDQSCRHTAEHCFSVSPVRLERLNAIGDLS
jgi:hypothetical protein